MKKIILLIAIAFTANLYAQAPRYIYNGRVEVKQGPSLSKLKNPMQGGFELPQFNAIDLDLDGTKDLLIFDRATKKFYTFLNDKIPNTVSYTYAPQYEVKLPNCNNFCLSYDYNNDGRVDLFVEANGFMEQYKNTSVSSLSFAAPDTLFDYNGINIYCPSTNIPSFNDIDNDGDMDILSWDPLGFTIAYYKNWRVEKGLTSEQWKFKMVDECWGKFYLAYSLNLGYHCPGFGLLGGDDYTPPPAPNSWSIHSGSTLLTLDIDSDGDYEAFLGDIFYNYLYFIKNGKTEFGYPKDTMIAKDSLYPSLAERMEVNYFPAAYFLDVDNDGKRDIIMAPNDASGASKNAAQIYFYKNIGTDRKPIFHLIQKNFLQDGIIDLGGNSAPTFTDIDSDGDDDLFIATRGDFTKTYNSRDQIYYYKNTGTLLNPRFELVDTNFLNLASKALSGIKPCFGDVNGDGKKDLIFGESNGGLRYYINTSTANNITFVENNTLFAGFSTRNYTAPNLADYNKDGKLDLFVGNYDGFISYYQNTGTNTAPVFTKQVDSVGKICVREVDDYRNFYGEGASVPVVADLDKDGKLDLLVGGKLGLYIYKNIEGKFNDSLTLTDTIGRFAASQLPVKRLTGNFVCPAIAQLDSDAVYDIMLGNNGGGVSLFSTYEFKGKVGLTQRMRSYDNVHITPNPASSSIKLEGFDHEMYSLLIYDATGKTILFEPEFLERKSSIDISGLTQGVYFINITAADGKIFHGKFVKM